MIADSVKGNQLIAGLDIRDGAGNHLRQRRKVLSSGVCQSATGNDFELTPLPVIRIFGVFLSHLGNLYPIRLQ
ncbi:hypothetical protein N9406_00975 [Verrucomicrobiales bacterium]|nr:hypothetical protein [Verrucomicrobiales bacterium]